MPMYWTFKCFLGCIYTVYYIVYIVFLVLNWLSNLEFWLPKKKDQVAQIGVRGGRGGLGNSGNAWKKTFFFRWPLPLLTSNSSESTFLNLRSRSSFFSFCSSRSTRVSFISPFQTKSCQFIKDNVLTICFLGFLFPLGHISLLLIHLLICLVQLKCVNF